MKILYICHRIPYPPDKGDKIRAFHQLRAISQRHEVDLFTLADDAGDVAHQAELRAHCHQLTVARVRPKAARLRALPYLLTNKPLTVPYFYSAELQAEVRQALLRRSYDRIFVYCSVMAQYVESVGGHIPIVMDFVDVDSGKWMQYASFTRFPFSAVYRREGRTLRAYEQKVCEKAACVLVTTEREARLVREMSPKARVHVVANGVDMSYFNPEAVPRAVTSPTVIFTGDMSYFPNEEAVTFFARKVLPIIHKSVPTARFLIVGRNPGARVRKLGEGEGVEVTGFVPDVRAHLARAQVAVAPFSIAAGIQNKILEALAYGLPVVATSRAAQALSPGVRDRVDTADSAEEMAAKTVLLLSDPQLAQQKAMDARSQVAEDYRWDRWLDLLLQLLEYPTRTTTGTPQIQSLA